MQDLEPTRAEDNASRYANRKWQGIHRLNHPANHLGSHVIVNRPLAWVSTLNRRSQKDT